MHQCITASGGGSVVVTATTLHDAAEGDIPLPMIRASNKQMDTRNIVKF